MTNELTLKEVTTMGGNALKKKRGRKHYQEIGKRGGEKVKATHDADYYKRIGTLGSQRRWNKKVEKKGLLANLSDFLTGKKTT